MKPILIACIAFVCLLGNVSLAQFENKSLAFKDGEWFEMRIHFGILNTAHARFSLNKTEFEGKEVFHAQALGKTTGLFRWFYKVDDDYQTFFDPDSGLPKYFIRDIYENGYTKNVQVRFDQQNHIAMVNDLEKETTTKFSTLSDVQDLISIFYYLRNVLPKKNLRIGESFNFNMFFDEENYVLDLKYLGRETIKTPFGKIWCLKFRPSVKVGRVFKTKNSLTLWISEDNNRIPIRLQASLSIGNIRADLEKVRNLAHPFKIVVD
ncbi:MAG: DUF3108 domain-containing protein [Flavobacteriaceae bacterium]|nr:DUF3108 domain-containing protein [Flavobacteriaceae bacterium]MCY4216952.1 DUF3108 domain-containing protein [Flavobacteriaceae bacterium]MCY4253620.1 DUF3108 domain-containing protein [Flavobacteriaceae bacterium]